MRSSYEYMNYLQVVQVFVRTPSSCPEIQGAAPGTFSNISVYGDGIGNTTFEGTSNWNGPIAGCGENLYLMRTRTST